VSSPPEYATTIFMEGGVSRKGRKGRKGFHEKDFFHPSGDL
jgi:hypothetical protein